MKRALLATSLCLTLAFWLVGDRASAAPGDGTAAVSSVDPAAVDSVDPAALGSIPVRESQSGPWAVRRSDGRGGGGGGGGERSRGGAVTEGMGDAGPRREAPGRGGRADGPPPPAPTTAAPTPRPSGPPPSAPPAADDEPMVESEGLASGSSEDGLERGEPTAPRSATSPTQAPLRAGSTDDNVEFDAFVGFVEQQFSSRRVGGFSQKIDVRGRRALRVVDASGRPVPAARITVLDETSDRAVWRATTQGDGAAPFYPRVAGVAPGAALVVDVRAGDERARAMWDGLSDCTVTLAGPRPSLEPLGLDVCFIIDTTGSMGDELGRIQQSLLAVTERLRGLGQEFELRYGAVLYKDLGDEYLTSAHPFTSDVRAFSQALGSIRAGGGGDGPESLNQGLAVAVNGMEWRERAGKVAFLITDAPPHMDYAGDVSYAKTLEAAVARGVKVHSVASSGLDADGTMVLRQAAQFTRGKFLFIEYGGDAQRTAASHGVQGPVASNNLDAIIFEQLRDEVARWGK